MIEKGNKVTLEYEGKLDDGTVFDSSEKHGQPLVCSAGMGQLIPGFDNALIGMNEGEEKEFSIEPENAYGEIREELVQSIPKAQMKLDKDPEAGMQLIVGMPGGQQFPATIVDVTDDTVKVDLNHPMAGKKLNFKIKIVKIEEGEPEKADEPAGSGESSETTEPEKADEPAGDGSLEDLAGGPDEPEEESDDKPEVDSKDDSESSVEESDEKPDEVSDEKPGESKEED